jgi:capsular polysaccharide biosynthesis protein
VDLILILRELWRRRLLVVLIALAAIAVGWVVGFQPSFPPKSRSYTVGIATARVLVDTPQSQVVEVAPKGSETLGSRASVLANLMVDGELKDAIAKRAGLEPKQLIAQTQASGGPVAIIPIGPKDRSLTTGVLINSDLAQLPIIKIESQAPTVKEAAKIADAVTALGEYLDSKANVEGISSARRLQVSGLGAAQVHEATRGPGKVMALAAALLTLLAGCALVLMVSALVRGWRLAVRLEQDFAEDDDAFPDLLEDDLDAPSTATAEADAPAAARR